MQTSHSEWVLLRPRGICWQTHLYRFEAIDLGGGSRSIMTPIENALHLAGGICGDYRDLPDKYKEHELEKLFVRATGQPSSENH